MYVIHPSAISRRVNTFHNDFETMFLPYPPGDNELTLFGWFSGIYRHTLVVGNKSVDHSDIGGASTVGAAPTTPSSLIEHLAAMDWAKATARRDVNHLSFTARRRLYMPLSLLVTSAIHCNHRHHISQWTNASHNLTRHNVHNPMMTGACSHLLIFLLSNPFDIL